jgi:uncharacterized membrane protein
MWLAFFSWAQAEKISNFDVQVDLQPDGSFIVTETITYDFEGAQRRGIYRNVSNRHAQPASAWYKNRFIDLELISVQKNGQSEPYQEEPYDGLSVRIGRPDVYITGQHEYQISYRVNGAIASYEDFDEFYWNVTGDEWSVPIENARLVLKAPPGILTDQVTCYAGLTGTNTRCLQATRVNDSRFEFDSGYLSPGEQLTVAHKVQLSERPLVNESINPFLAIIAGFVVAISSLVFLVYRWKNRYKIAAPIIPQYEPLPDFKPMFTGVLIDNRLDARDISAGIVYLAQQGFISIKETQEKVLFLFEAKDYEITLLRSASEAESDFHRDLLELFFGYSGFAVNEETGQRTVKLSEVKQQRQAKNAAAVRALKKDVVDELVDLGLLEQNFKRVSIFSFIFQAVFVIYIIQFMALVVEFVVVVIAIVAIIGIVLTVSLFSHRRTRQGFVALNYLQGFKDFLATTEKERYKYHNAPSKSPEQFMEYLPYAIAFGVEEEWAEVFKDIAITTPDWYATADNEQSFMVGDFSRSLNSFTASLPGTYYQSSSAGSGSSGGGFSGGGSGGGGGGSW